MLFIVDNINNINYQNGRKKMTPQQQLDAIDEKIKEAEKLIEQLYEYRRRHINQYELNKVKEEFKR